MYFQTQEQIAVWTTYIIIFQIVGYFVAWVDFIIIV